MTTKPKKPKAPKSDSIFRQFFIDDDGGNKLQVKQNDKLMILTLLLLGDKPRRVGVVTKSTRTIEMKRKNSVHLFRKISMRGGFGFCLYVLKEQTSIDWVRLSDDEGNHWKIPVKFILDNGQILFFKQQNFEKQIFVTLEELEQFLVKPEENRRLDF